MNEIKLLMLIVFLVLSSGCSSYTEGDPIEKNLPDKYCFLILDIQNDFMSKEGRLPIDQSQSQNIIQTINGLLPIFVQNDIDIVYIRNEFKETDTIANWFRNNAAMEGADGANFSADLKIINDTFFSKSSSDAFSNKSFDRYLRENKVTKLIVAGVFADQCVLSTIKGGVNREYEVYVISDAIGAKNDKNIKKALSAYEKLNVNAVTSKQITNKFNP